MDRLKNMLLKISWKTYIFAGILHFLCIPYICKALWLAVRKVPLTFFLNGVFHTILFLIGAFLLSLAYKNYCKQETKRIQKKWKLALCILALLIYVPAMGLLLKFGLSLISFSKTGSFMANTIYRILWTSLVCEGIFFLWKKVGTEVEQKEETAVNSTPAAKGITKKLWKWAVAAVVVLVITGIIPRIIWNDNHSFKNQIDNKLAQAKLYDQLEETEKALQKYQQARDYVSAIQGYLNQDVKLLYALYSLDKDNNIYQNLYLASNPDLSVPEWEVLHGIAQKEDYFCLLAFYDKQEELTDYQKQLQKECINICVTQEYLYGDVDGLAKKQLEEEKLQEIVENYSQELEKIDVLEVLVDISRSEEITRDLLDRVFALAEKNPENLEIQRMALTYGREYVNRSAGQKIVNKYKNYIYRYNGLINEVITDKEELAKVKLYLGKLLQEINFEEGILLLEESFACFPMEETAYTLMMNYNDLNNGEKLVEIVKKAEESGFKDARLLFYGGVGHLTLQEKNVTEALKYGIKLAELIKESEGEVQQINMEYFHNFVEYLKLNNNYINTLYDQCYVIEFSEEEQKILDQSPFLSKYVAAMDCLYNQGDWESATLNFQEADSLIPGLAIVQEMIGNSYYAMEDYERAITYLENSIAVGESVTASYTLAHCYQQVGRLEDALFQCDTILQAIENLQMNYDPYGIYDNTKKLQDELSASMGNEQK